jgi:hypothetical protein
LARQFENKNPAGHGGVFCERAAFFGYSDYNVELAINFPSGLAQAC